MIRILQCVNNMNRAGLETMLMNYYRNIDRTKIQFDFLTHRPDRADYDDEIEALGGRIYRAPRLYPQNYPAYFAFMRKFFREHPEYKIVHSHIDAMSYLPLLAAKRAGVPIRIAHSHSTSIDRDIKYAMKQYFRYRLPEVATHCFACGTEAGEFLFQEGPFSVVPNAVDIERFLFDQDMRKRKRKEFGLEEAFVIGHVGRFCYPKNHMFLIDIFHEVWSRQKNAVLLLIGTGEKEAQIRNRVKELGMDANVMFLGNRSDVAELYQAMDVFVLPSLFEGVPLVGIEAQAAGLPCVFSDRVPREVEIADNCAFVPLKTTAAKWAEEILCSAGKDRLMTEDQTKKSRYNVKTIAKELESYYLRLSVPISNT